MKRNAAAVVFVCLSASAPALAADPSLSSAASAEVSTLEKELTRNYQQLTQTKLAQGDCEMACRALGSMRRSAERICAIEPGTRCNDARRRTTEAEALVRDACPSCAAAPNEAIAAPHPEPAPKPGTDSDGAGAKKREDSLGEARPANAPQAESRRGGCAGCATSPAEAPASLRELGGLAFALALAALRRRRARAGSPPSLPASDRHRKKE